MGLYSRKDSKDSRSIMAKMIADEETTAMRAALEASEEYDEAVVSINGNNNGSAAVNNENGSTTEQVLYSTTFEVDIASTTTTSTATNNTNTTEDEINVWFLIRGTFLASLGGGLFGFDTGIISGTLSEMQLLFDLTSIQEEMIVSFMYLGAMVGAAVGGYVCDTMGRRFAILLTDSIFFCGALLLSTATNVELMLVGRLVVGFAISISGIADVAYLHEIAPRKYRGAMVSCNEASFSLGFLLAYCLDYSMGDENTETCKILFALGGAIALLQMFGMLFMPESPVWLESRGRVSEAAKIRQVIHGCGNSGGVVSNEEARSSTKSNNNNNNNDNSSYISNPSSTEPSTTATFTQPRVSLLSLLSSLKYLLTQHFRQATIAMFLATAQQFCGHTNVLNFAPEIFAQAGLGEQASFLSSLFMGLLKFVVTVLVICMIDRLGRRTLLLFGISTISVSLLLLIIAFRDDKLDQNREIAIIGAMGVVAGYAASFGPLTWLLTSELFPAHIRGRALGGTMLLTYFCASLVSYTFLSLQEVIGSRWGPFLLYLGVSVGSLAFVYLAVPDTADKSVEQIDNDMGKMWWWRINNNSNRRLSGMPSVVEVTTNEGRAVSID